jgi:hypothetical protein
MGFGSSKIGSVKVTDDKSKVSSNDTTPDYLVDKIVAGTGVSITETDDGSNETLVISSNDSEVDHGELAGLDDDDHSQYHNDTRGDARYFQQSEFLDSSSGSGDSGKPVKLDADGNVDATMINDADVDHDNLTNTHNLTTDIDHDSITNTHDLTTDIDHDSISNTHNLTTDVDHDSISNTHNLTTDIDHDSIANTHNLTTDIDHDSLTNTHDLTTDIDHDTITNNHNLTTDIDHDQLTNTHNLTTDIDHDQLTNYSSDEHFTEASIDHGNITNTHNLTTDIDHDSITNTHNLTTDIDHDQLTNYSADEHFTEASIDHTNISNIGSNSHATIDTHLGSSSNPHTVTASQVGKDTAQWNADELYGIPVPSSPGSGDDEKYLKYDHDTTSYVLDNPPGGVSGSDVDDFTIKYVNSKIQLADRIESNIMLNAFRIAINGSLSQLDMVDGVSDEFEDESGIDTGSSSNQLYDSSDDYYHPVQEEELDYMEYASDAAALAAYDPSVGADITSGETFSSSGSNVANAFDDTPTTTYWASPWESITDQWIKVQFSSGKIIKKLTFNSSNVGGNNPNLCWLEGSNNDSDWTKINCASAGDGLTKSGNNFTCQSGYVSLGYATFTNSTSYTYYRLWMDTGHGLEFIHVGELELMEATDFIPKPESEASIKQQGSYSLKITAAQTDSLNETLTRDLTGSEIDLTGVATLYFYARASRTGTNFSVKIHDSGGTTTTKTVNISSANTWELQTWDVSGVSDANKDDIDSIIIEITNADAANTIYLDDFKSGSLNMTLISNATTAEAQPDNARLILYEEDVDSITENTDVKGYVSRDGGTTWTQATLVDEGNYSGSKRILADTIDISGQPAGTSMKFKVETANLKDLKIHGVGVTWD